MTLQAAYESLVTMEPGDYINLKPIARDEMGAHAGRQGLALHHPRGRQVRDRQRR